LALDIDNTVINPSAPGAKFCRTAQDWEWWHPSVPDTLARYHAAGYTLVAFSNQRGISIARDSGGANGTSAAVVRARMQAIAARLGPRAPLLVMFAVGKDFYRKPNPGMPLLLQALCCGGLEIDFGASIFVGDAAGRRVSAPGGGPARSDHHPTDLSLALNCGMLFATPEAFFGGSTRREHVNPLGLPLALGALNAKANKLAGIAGGLGGEGLKFEHDWVPALHLCMPWREAVSTGGSASSDAAGLSGSLTGRAAAAPAPAELAALLSRLRRLDGVNRHLDEAPPDAAAPLAATGTSAAAAAPPAPAPGCPHRPEIVLLVGPTSAGNTGLSITSFSHHTRINQDLLKDRKVCLARAHTALQAGHPVVVDATNLARETRREWVSLAASCRVPIRAVVIFAARREAAHAQPRDAPGWGDRTAGGLHGGTSGGGASGSGAAGATVGAGGSSGGSSMMQAFLAKAGTSRATASASPAAASSRPAASGGSSAGGLTAFPHAATYTAYGETDKRLLKGMAFHLNTLRAISPLGGFDGPHDQRAVPSQVIQMHVGGIVPESYPSLAEGFAEIIPVRFVPLFLTPPPSSPLSPLPSLSSLSPLPHGGAEGSADGAASCRNGASATAAAEPALASSKTARLLAAAAAPGLGGCVDNDADEADDIVELSSGDEDDVTYVPDGSGRSAGDTGALARPSAASGKAASGGFALGSASTALATRMEECGSTGSAACGAGVPASAPSASQLAEAFARSLLFSFVY
jgi:DNA 3'-phosphatase